MTPLPTRLQISPTNGEQLDERTALENFLGKSRTDAARMLFDADASNLRYIEDFVHMGIEGFRYYFPTVETYLRDERSNDDPVFVGALIYVIESRMGEDGWQLATAEMRSVLLTIDAERGRFDLEAETVLALQQVLERLG
jgi:hypothetical protein